MNKKKLSVVMAGAMLASSVAPVLAASTSELDSSQLGSLVEKVQAKLTEKRFDESETTTVKVASDSAINDASSTIAEKSVYYVKITKADGTNTATVEKDIYNATKAGNEKVLRGLLQDAFQTLTAGDKVEIYSLGFNEETGKVLSYVKTTPVYKAEDFSNNAIKYEIVKGLTNGAALNGTAGNNTAIIDGLADLTFKNDTLEIAFNSGVSLDSKYFVGYDLDSTKNANKLTLKDGDEKLDFSKFISAADIPDSIVDGTGADAVKGFPKVTLTNNDKDEELIETITITGTENNYKTTDLYDGLMLTTEGHDFLSMVKVAEKKGYTVAMNSITGATIAKNTESVDLSVKNGEYGFVVTITNKAGKSTKYTVKGAEKQTERLASWVSMRLAKVDILAGDNRYETAVSIAKEQLEISEKYLGDNNTTPSNIVLVNGKSLVDGLAASPLAASLKADEDGTNAAPILLTEADELPKATKEFLKELLADKKIGEVNTTIHLVGGTSVLSRSLEKELRSYGFDIKRYNGANREETSLEVAEAIDKDNTNTNRFVVGANGEADAMSIAPVASDSTKLGNGKVTPIIVAKKGGISYDALNALDGKNVTVIGGEASVSKDDFDAMEEAVGKNGFVERISGENRQATNAKILKEYYANTNVASVIVSKDGRGNNEELVDALTAANFAVKVKAPIVLAKSSLSAEQLNMVNLYAKSSKSLYQVGLGVDKDNVIKVLADRLGLTD